MTNGIFQGANQANFSDAVALGIVGTQPTAGGFTSVSITNSAAFRYVRYLSPNGGYGNVAELEFYGYPWSVPAMVPSGLSALAVSASQINLVWNAATDTGGSGMAGYQVYENGTQVATVTATPADRAAASTARLPRWRAL